MPEIVSRIDMGTHNSWRELATLHEGATNEKDKRARKKATVISRSSMRMQSAVPLPSPWATYGGWMYPSNIDVGEVLNEMYNTKEIKPKPTGMFLRKDFDKLMVKKLEEKYKKGFGKARGEKNFV